MRDDTPMNSPHIPVLPAEVLAALVPPEQVPESIIDGTLGAGGHTKSLLDAGVQTVLGLDLDPQALEIARTRLADYGDRFISQQRSYETMQAAAQSLGWDAVDGILLDLGVSSMQVDTAERGFAFMQDGPLDMRFNPDAESAQHRAYDLVNYWEASELADIFFNYGEERNSRRIATAITQNRPIETTSQLAEIVKQATPPPKRKKGQPISKIHPATRVFQALRIAVNDELGVIERTLPQAIDLLRPGGRLAVISFHSLEDRIVKQTFKAASTEIVSPPGMMLEEKAATVKLITRKPIVAQDAEITDNPRSRSAKLRVIEKL